VSVRNDVEQALRESLHTARYQILAACSTALMAKKGP